MALGPNVKERIAGSVWAAAWMWPLAAPAIDISQGKTPHPVWAALGLATFIACYVVVVVNGFDADRRRGRSLPARGDLVLLGVLTAIGITLFATLSGAGNNWPIVLLYVSVAGVAAFRPALAGAWTVSIVMLTIGWELGHPHAYSSSGAAQLILGMLMAGALVQVVKRMQSYIRVLRDTRAELAHNAVAEERLRFARDLHDLLGHTISVIVVKAEVVRRLVEREPALAAEAAADIEAIGRRALTEVREAVNGYRAPEFAAELDNVRTALADAGISVRVRHDGPPVPLAASQVFAWAIREAATNVIRHSGALVCEITVTVDGTAATLEIRDTGHGYRHPAPDSSDGRRIGVGLVGLRERVTAAGGTLTTGNALGGGFHVLVTIPAARARSSAAGPDPSMWAVLDDAQRGNRAASEPAIPATDPATDPAVAPISAPNAPAQAAPAAGSMVVADRGKSS